MQPVRDENKTLHRLEGLAIHRSGGLTSAGDTFNIVQKAILLVYRLLLFIARFFSRIATNLREVFFARWQRVEAWLNRRTGGYFAHLVRAIRNFSQGTSSAVTFAYWALFSVFPLVILAIVVATVVFGTHGARPQVIAVLNQFMPTSMAGAIRDSIDQVNLRRGPSSLVGVIGLLLGANRLFNELQRSLSRIFRDERARPWYHQWVRSVMMMMTLAVLLILSANLSALFKTINQELGGRRSPLLGTSALLALVITNSALFGLMFRFIPHRKVSWKVLLPVAVGAALASELSRVLFDWYLLHMANLGAIYGSVSAVIGLLTWMFVIGCIILLSAELAVATDDWRLERLARLKAEAITVSSMLVAEVPETEAPAELAEPLLDDAVAAAILSPNTPLSALPPLDLASAQAAEVPQG